MGQQPHRTVKPKPKVEPSTIWVVRDYSDGYHPHTVARFESRAAAMRVRNKLESEKGYRNEQRYKVKERDVHETAESYLNDQ